jgi:hypothetical protein
MQTEQRGRMFVCEQLWLSWSSTVKVASSKRAPRMWAARRGGKERESACLEWAAASSSPLQASLIEGARRMCVCV